MRVSGGDSLVFGIALFVCGDEDALAGFFDANGRGEFHGGMGVAVDLFAGGSFEGAIVVHDASRAAGYKRQFF